MTIIARSSDIQDAHEALKILGFLEGFYPGFNSWYERKVMPELGNPNNVLLVAKHDEDIVGIALGKKGSEETKIRCVRVVDAMSNTGLGIKLIDTMIDILGVARPHCTVSEEMLHVYSRAFVNRYGFKLDHVSKGRYRSGKLEYEFNRDT